MVRYGIINFDYIDNYKRFEDLRADIKPRILSIFDRLNDYVKNELNLDSATGSWYINYSKNKKIIFFKIEPVPNKDKRHDKEGIYISICNEDYTLLPKDLRSYVQKKPHGERKPGNWEWHSIIKDMEDYDWACQLCKQISDIVLSRYPDSKISD
jgi:hypothetical protein